MKNIKITGLTIKPFAGRPFLLFLFLAIEIFIVLFFITDFRKYDNLHREQLFRAFEAGYRGATTSYDHSIQVIFNDEVNKPEVLKLIALALDDDKKRDACRNELYRLMLPSYESQKTIGILQFHFHLKDGTSFLRMHAPEKYGDNLFRRTAVYEVNKELKPVKGYEVGYFADGYRFLYPLFYNGRHVGSVEFGITTEGITNYLNHIYPAHYLFMINRTIVDNMTYADWKKRNYKESGLSDNFMIAQKTAGDTIVASINQKFGNKVRDRLAGMEQFVEQKTVDGKDYLITFLPVWDVKGDAAAYFIQYISDSSLVHQSRITIIDITLFTLLLAAIFYSIDNIQSKNKSLQNQNTELERMSKTLHESEKKYRDLFESAMDAIFILDLKGNFIDVNSIAYKRLGYLKNEMLSMHISQLDPPEFATKVPERLAQILEQGFAVFESAHIRKDGTVMPVEINASLYDYEGKKVYLSFIRDITKRKKAEEELLLSRQSLSLHIEQTPLAVIEFDIEGRIRGWNPAAVNVFGFSREEAIGQYWTFIVPSTIWETLDGVWEKLVTQSGGARSTNENTTKDGRTIISEWFNTPLIDFNGKTIGVASLVMDVTERKMAEEKIRKALKEKETLLREIHHRVKNNMQVITSLLNLQARKIEDPNFRKPFEESEQRIRAMALVHERLYQREDLSGINFSDYIHNIVAELKTAYRMDERNVAIKFNVADIVLEIDSAIPCGLIINELITNCFKYAFPDDRSGEVLVNFTTEGNTSNLTIKDNGIGLPAGFDHRQTTTLGMQLVNVLTRQLMGTFQIRSDGGTEVVINFTRKERIDGKEKNTDS